MFAAASSSSASASRKMANAMMNASHRRLRTSSTRRHLSSSSKEEAPASLWSRLICIPKRHPFAFQLGIATAKTSAADIMAQTVGERKGWDEIDWRRNGIFVFFGFTYLGAFQWWLMVTKYRQWFPTMDRFAKLGFADKLKDTAGILDACKMVLFDITIHLPIMYFPTYYTVKELVGGTSWNPADWARDGVSKYLGNAREDLTAMIQLWGPSDCVQFVLPVHVRLPFRHFVSFFWTAYVSLTRGAIDDASGEVGVVVLDREEVQASDDEQAGK